MTEKVNISADDCTPIGALNQDKSGMCEEKKLSRYSLQEWMQINDQNQSK